MTQRVMAQSQGSEGKWQTMRLTLQESQCVILMHFFQGPTGIVLFTMVKSNKDQSMFILVQSAVETCKHEETVC